VILNAVQSISTTATTLARATAASTTGADTGDTTLELIRLFVLLVGAAALVTLLARRINLPYTVALVAFGMVAGAVFSPLRVEITPQLVLVVLLPALVFEASYQIDFAKLRPSLLGVSLLAGPGVLVSAALVALFLHLGAGLPVDQAFIVGAMLAATDPAAVIATFKRLSSPRRLATLVEAESIFNDGTGIVAFTIAVGLVTGSASSSPVETVTTFVSVVAISAAIGAAAGWAASRILPTVGDHLIEISLSVVLAYGTYLAADALHQSGVIATSMAGIVLGNYGRRLGLSQRTEEALDTVWEFVAFLATAFVFLLVGFAISLRSLADVAVPIGWAVVATVAGRGVIVYGFLGPLRLLRRRRSKGRYEVRRPEISDDRGRDEGDLPVGWLHVIYWSGLRGAVSTALALSLPADLPNRSMLQGITFGVVLFTLLVQATTAEFVIERWGRKPTRTPRSNSSSNAAPKPSAAATAAATAAGVAAVDPVAATPSPAVSIAADSTIDEKEPVEPSAEPKPGRAARQAGR
jgi:monovalent cation:H+ antiporter, CPA1 family